MATGGGVTVPIPQKRPTVIRQSKIPDSEEEQTSPGRPAPPVPVRPAPTVPPRTNDVAPVRPQPSVPGRPTEQVKLPAPSPVTGRPPPPVPSRTGDVARTQANGTSVAPRSQPQPEKPEGKPKEAKVRPEITIVCARPMSEVGFRGQDSSSIQSNSSTENTNLYVEMPLRPKPPPLKPAPPLIKDESNSPRDLNGLFSEVDAAPQRRPPPPASRPNLHQPSSSDKALAAPERPPVSPRAEVSQRSVVPTNVPPPVPKQLGINASEGESRLRSANPMLGVPLPPVPRAPPAPNRPPSIAARNHNAEDESCVTLLADEIEQKEEEKTNNENVKSNGDNVYSVINKPKRPTIIRPGRPSVKENSEECDGVPEPPKLPPKIVPRLSDLEDKSPSENVQKSKSNNSPEFLNLKLKTTVHEDSIANNSDNTSVKATAGSGATEKNGPASGFVPPVAPKPKPTVLPKPKIAAKPTVSAKPVVAKPVEKDSDSTEKKVPLHSEVKRLDNDGVEKSTEKPEFALPNKPGSVKRPTIIRPSRPAQWGSSENVRSVDNAGDTDPVTVKLKGPVDDNAVRTRPQPPLPVKRPVSMSNIPQALAQEAASSLRSSSSSHSVKASFSSSENLSMGDQQKKPSPPRPVARARPMSMAAGDGLKMSIPSISPRIQPKLLNLSGDSETKPSDKLSAEPHRPPPPKPAKSPASPRKPGGKASSSDEEGEFVMAQTRPDRPQGPPKPAHRQSMVESEFKKPTPCRPGGPPSGRKMSSPEEERVKELESEVVKMRPARPGSKPSRPMSMPVKSVLPSKPKLPKSGASKSKGLPPLPPRPSPGHPAYYHMMSVPHGQAVFDYTARQQDELSFKKEDMIILVRAVDAEWVVGRIDETEGMFPRDFVKVLMPLPGEKLGDEDSSDDNEEFYDASPEKPDIIGRGPRCRARFDFDAEGHDDLAFEEGDVIRLLERVGMEWRRGEINGRTGLFPLAYVEVIEDLPEEGGDVSSTVVTALFDFEGEAGDLNFQAGEKIHVTHCVNEEWLFGEIGQKKGQFPVQFIDHVPPDLPPLPQKELSPSHADKIEAAMNVAADSLSQWDAANSENIVKSTTSKGDNPGSETPYCIGTYDFPGQAEGDLSFSVGDRIEIVERIDADWLKGKLNGQVGMFPAGFVDVKVDISDKHQPPSDSSSPEGVVAVALYDFHGEADNELTFSAGDQLTVQELLEGATDWRWGVHHGRRGIFPASFVDTHGS